MANATCTQSSIAKLEKKTDDRFEVLSGRIDEVSSGIEELRNLLRAQALQNLNDGNSVNNNRQPHNDETHFRREPQPSSNHYSTRISKVEFPHFDGSQVSGSTSANSSSSWIAPLLIPEFASPPSTSMGLLCSGT